MAVLYRGRWPHMVGVHVRGRDQMVRGREMSRKPKGPAWAWPGSFFTTLSRKLVRDPRELYPLLLRTAFPMTPSLPVGLASYSTPSNTVTLGTKGYKPLGPPSNPVLTTALPLSLLPLGV